MNIETIKLKDRADKARIMYKQNLISREEAIAEVKPYINLFNAKSKEIAKKHGCRPKFINFISYIR